MTGTPAPYLVHVPDETLTDLRARLALTRWPDEIAGSAWRYGTSLDFMRRLVAHWLDGFDWRAQEARINELAHFRLRLEDIDLHFIHEPGVGPDPTPLLLVHGWPGSVWEFHELIPRLTDPGRFGGDPADALTVVAPSLPGYTLSFTPGQRRLDLVEIADLFAELMAQLGYDRFGAQGGDWGSWIVSRLAHAHPQRVLGLHLNSLPVRLGAPAAEHATEEERAFQEELARWQLEEVGYSTIQGTRPQTLAYALTDSPAGLAGWIAEKLHVWTDNDGEIPSGVGLDWLLTNITLYWATGAINSSFWPYYATRHSDWLLPERVQTPTAYASFPHEVRHPPRSVAERAFNIARWSAMERGGHFAALEAPDLLAADVAAFFRGLRGD